MFSNLYLEIPFEVKVICIDSEIHKFSYFLALLDMASVLFNFDKNFTIYNLQFLVDQTAWPDLIDLS